MTRRAWEIIPYFMCKCTFIYINIYIFVFHAKLWLIEKHVVSYDQFGSTDTFAFSCLLHLAIAGTSVIFPRPPPPLLFLFIRCTYAYIYLCIIWTHTSHNWKLLIFILLFLLRHSLVSFGFLCHFNLLSPYFRFFSSYLFVVWIVYRSKQFEIRIYKYVLQCTASSQPLRTIHISGGDGGDK